RTLGRVARNMAGSLTETPGAFGQEMFDDAVFQRMERDDGEAPLWTENVFAGFEARLELAELVVHRYAQSLEGARRRMDLLGAAPEHPFGDLGQFARPENRACGDDGAGKSLGALLFAIRAQNIGK